MLGLSVNKIFEQEYFNDRIYIHFCMARVFIVRMFCTICLKARFTV